MWVPHQELIPKTAHFLHCCSTIGGMLVVLSHVSLS